MGSVNRPYSGERRQQQSRQTRARILHCARQLFLAQGYAAVTVAAIAGEAGVHVDTVYALVGRKPEIVRELVELALSGLDHPQPAEERAYVAAIRAARDPAEKLAIYAAATREMLERLAPVFAVLQDAAAVDPTAAEVWRYFGERRARNMRDFVDDVIATGGARPDLDRELAADSVWATNSPELYRMLTTERGWRVDTYQRWLEDTWKRILLR